MDWHLAVVVMEGFVAIEFLWRLYQKGRCLTTIPKDTYIAIFDDNTCFSLHNVMCECHVEQYPLARSSLEL